MADASKAEFWKRADGKWAWHLLGHNGKVIATDGNQGYSNKAECESMAERVKSGEYADAPVVEIADPNKPKSLLS